MKLKLTNENVKCSYLGWIAHNYLKAYPYLYNSSKWIKLNRLQKDNVKDVVYNELKFFFEHKNYDDYVQYAINNLGTLISTKFNHIPSVPDDSYFNNTGKQMYNYFQKNKELCYKFYNELGIGLDKYL